MTRAASAARRGAAVRRGRRAALVAAAFRAGRAHAHLRRPRLARLRGRALRRRHRRRRGARRDGAVPRGPAAAPGEHDAFFQPTISDESGTLFEHCARALDHSLAVGAHGLPLIGTGDWNDGMNRVGERRQGRERLARLVPARDARRPSRRSPTRAARRARAATWRAHADALQACAGARGLGRRLVSPRLVRRRHAARLGDERRVPDRFDRAVLGRDLGRGRPERAAARDGGGRAAT